MRRRIRYHHYLAILALAGSIFHCRGFSYGFELGRSRNGIRAVEPIIRHQASASSCLCNPCYYTFHSIFFTTTALFNDNNIDRKRRISDASVDQGNDSIAPFEIKLDPTRPFRDFARDVKAAPFLENPLYKEIQIIYTLLVIAAIYQNFVDNIQKNLLQSFQFPFLLIAFHLLCISLSVELIGYKGYDREHMQSRMSALRALFSGPLEVYRVSKIDDIEAREARDPLVIEFDTSQDENIDSVERRRQKRLGKNLNDILKDNYIDISKSVIQEFDITAAYGCEMKVRQQLKRLSDDSRTGLKDRILWSSIKQDELNRRKFKLVQRFKNIDQLRQYQTSFQFQLWSEKMKAVLECPMDVLVTNENTSK